MFVVVDTFKKYIKGTGLERGLFKCKICDTTREVEAAMMIHVLTCRKMRN